MKNGIMPLSIMANPQTARCVWSLSHACMNFNFTCMLKKLCVDS